MNVPLCVDLGCGDRFKRSVVFVPLPLGSECVDISSASIFSLFLGRFCLPGAVIIVPLKCSAISRFSADIGNGSFLRL